jgi:hypothetical protein
MKECERKMLEEVALRNAVSKFRRLNAKDTKVASTPEVGLFWCDLVGNMYSETVPLPNAEDYGEFKILDTAHINVWDKAIRANRKWAGKEYEEIPRGRVVYHRDPKNPEFVIYMPKQISKFKSKILARFNLPTGHTRFDFSDEHYRME